MPKFKYEAMSASGSKVSGVLTAASENAAVLSLREEGYFPTKIKEQSESTFTFGTPKIKARDLGAFCQQMSAMLKAGVPIAKTLEILAQQTEDPTLRNLMPEVCSQVNKGLSVSEAFKPYEANFPAFFLNMVEAGENSGTLDSCIDRAGISFMRMAKLNSRVKGAMIYPIVVLSILGVLVLAMMMFVLPQFAEIFDNAGADLPGLTQGLLSISAFMTNQWYIVLGVIVVIIVGIRVYLKTESGKTNFGILRLRAPKVGRLVSKIYAARFARTLSSLTSAGVSLPDALKITARTVQNRYVEKRLYDVVEGLFRGEPLSNQLEDMYVFPPMLTHVVRIGEESGALDDLLVKSADFYDDEADAAIAAMIALMEPLLIIMLAVIVVPIILSVLLPMFNMINVM